MDIIIICLKELYVEFHLIINIADSVLNFGVQWQDPALILLQLLSGLLKLMNRMALLQILHVKFMYLLVPRDTQQILKISIIECLGDCTDMSRWITYFFRLRN